MYKFLFLMACALSFFPTVVHAGIEITEIMYDVEGSDGGREWVEILNTGSASVDLEGWWFYEGGNHGFQNEGSMVLAPGAYAVIVDTPSKFSADQPGVTALILDSSSFSLRNTGATIGIRNTEKVDVHTVSYVPQEGADGTGKTLQLVSGSWTVASATPGRAPSGSAPSVTGEDGGGATQTGVTTGGSSFAPPDTKRISVSGGPDLTVIAGADVLFSGEGFGTSGEPLDSARYLWTFGDGTSVERKEVLHSFAFPGQYSVVVNVQSGKYGATDYVQVNAEPSTLAIVAIISGTKGYIEVHNGSRETLNISYWLLRTPEGHFIFPVNTRIRGGVRVKFPNSVTLLNPNTSVELLYPNGTVAYRYTPIQVSPPVGVTKSVPVIQNTTQKQVPTVANKAPDTEVVSDATSTEHIIEEQEEMPVEEDVSALVTASLSASVDDQSTRTWLLVLGGLLALSACAVLVIRTEGRGADVLNDIPSLADTITIIEEE